MQDKVRGAIGSLPPREQKVITLYYYGDVTMKQIGAEIGVNESRVSQLHARAIKRLRVVLADMAPAEAMSALKSAVLAFHQKPVMAKAALAAASSGGGAHAGGDRGEGAGGGRQHHAEPREAVRGGARRSADGARGGGRSAVVDRVVRSIAKSQSSVRRAVTYVDGPLRLFRRGFRARSGEDRRA